MIPTIAVKIELQTPRPAEPAPKHTILMSFKSVGGCMKTKTKKKFRAKQQKIIFNLFNY